MSTLESTSGKIAFNSGIGSHTQCFSLNTVSVFSILMYLTNYDVCSVTIIIFYERTVSRNGVLLFEHVWIDTGEEIELFYFFIFRFSSC